MPTTVKRTLEHFADAVVKVIIRADTSNWRYPRSIFQGDDIGLTDPHGYLVRFMLVPFVGQTSA